MEDKKLAYLKHRVLNYLKFRKRSEKEVFVFLKKIIDKKGFSGIDPFTIINQLKDWGLVNDEEFVEWFASSRKKSKPKGEKLIVQELKQKGIDQKIIDQYFSKNKFDEEELATSLIRKYSHRWQNLIGLKKKEKISRFLLSRGFSFETVKKIIKKISLPY